MPFLQVFRAIVGNPDFPVLVFPNKNLQGEIDRNAGSSQHKRCSAFRIAEDQQLGWAHFHPRLFRFSAVIDEREQRDSLGLQNILELFHCLIDGVIARFVDDAFAGRDSHDCLLYNSWKSALLTGTLSESLTTI